MLACNRLCIEFANGSPSLDYRIEGESVERRLLAPNSSDETWHKLTPKELRAHVANDTIVARWLARRMGIKPLMRACNEDNPINYSYLQNETLPRAA